MSIYLLARKAKRDQRQRERNARQPFSLYYTNMTSGCQALPRKATRQKSYNQYQQKKIKQYVEPRVGFKRMPNFSASQYIDNKKSDQIRRCAKLIPCEKGKIEYDILAQTTLDTPGDVGVDWIVMATTELGTTFQKAFWAAKEKIMKDRSKGIMWAGFYTTGDTSFTFSKSGHTTLTNNALHNAYIYNIVAHETSSCCSSSSRLKPIVTKDLKFNSASSQIQKKKAERNCCSGEKYDIPIKANTICRPAASTVNAKKN